MLQIFSRWETSRILMRQIFTRISLACFLWDIGKSIAPHVTPQNAAFHMELVCFIESMAIKNHS